jgi:diaminohydroxyphosphoribosylaminopyrimidine deaminase/5-amino-6-(5-phosphoribosylamino)uracil reductase
MERAGIEVYHMVDFEQKARSVNAGYFKRREEGLPFVRLKLAMSLDGRTALADGRSKWITGTAARGDVQRLRASASAVITGINTVLIDDPFLTVRSSDLSISDEERKLNATLIERQPLRVIIDSQLQTPGTARILNSGGLVKVYTLNEDIIGKALADNVEIIQTGSCNKRVNLQFVLESLASDFSCNEVLIEAGPSLSGAFIETGLVDELILYIAPKILGSDGKPLLAITGLQSLDECQGFSVQKLTKIGEDIKLTLRAGQ